MCGKETEGGKGEGWGGGGRGWGGSEFVHGHRRMTIDPRIPTMPGRRMSGFCHPGGAGGEGGVGMGNCNIDARIPIMPVRSTHCFRL